MASSENGTLARNAVQTNQDAPTQRECPPTGRSRLMCRDCTDEPARSAGRNLPCGRLQFPDQSTRAVESAPRPLGVPPAYPPDGFTDSLTLSSKFGGYSRPIPGRRLRGHICRLRDPIASHESLHVHTSPISSRLIRIYSHAVVQWLVRPDPKYSPTKVLRLYFNVSRFAPGQFKNAAATDA